MKRELKSCEISKTWMPVQSIKVGHCYSSLFESCRCSKVSPHFRCASVSLHDSCGKTTLRHLGAFPGQWAQNIVVTFVGWIRLPVGKIRDIVLECRTVSVSKNGQKLSDPIGTTQLECIRFRLNTSAGAWQRCRPAAAAERSGTGTGSLTRSAPVEFHVKVSTAWRGSWNWVWLKSTSSGDPTAFFPFLCFVSAFVGVLQQFIQGLGRFQGVGLDNKATARWWTKVGPCSATSWE